MPRSTYTSTDPSRSNRFHQWSEVYEIPRKPSRLAEIVLHPGKFFVNGPDELVTEMQTLISIMDGQDPEDVKWAMLNLWSNWHVICHTGNELLLCDLRYWDTDGLIYSGPELIPAYTPKE